MKHLTGSIHGGSGNVIVRIAHASITTIIGAEKFLGHLQHTVFTTETFSLLSRRFWYDKETNQSVFEYEAKPKPMYKCCSPSCPGYPWKASDYPHPCKP